MLLTPMLMTRCPPETLQALVAEATRVFRAPGTRRNQMARDYPLLFAPANRRHLWVAMEHPEATRPAAHVGFCLRRVRVAGRLVKVACLGAVFTREDLRGGGVATRLLDRALADARAEGATAVMASGVGPLYQRRGFVRVPALAAFHVREPRGLTAVRDADVDRLVAMHAARPTRFLRTASEWRRLLAARMAGYLPGRVRVMRAAGGGVVAYLACETKGAARPLRVIETGGSTMTLGRAFSRAAAHPAARPVRLVVGPHDGRLLAFASAEGWPYEAVKPSVSLLAWDGTLSAADFPAYGLDYV
jgi:GNAT superfamily N-acetyltransferase